MSAHDHAADDDAAVRRRRILSALADGDAAPSEAADALAGWQHDVDSRRTWHAYQLIGDVLRREDLANPVARDEALLQAVRARLAAEPVVLAPGALPAAAPAAAPIAWQARAGGWLRRHGQGPAVMAACFLAVFGGLSVLRGPAGPAALQARAPVSAPPAFATAQTLPATGLMQASLVSEAAPAPASAVASGALGQALAANPQAALAPYLAAHRGATTRSAFQMPDAGVRDVSYTAPSAP